MVLAATMLLGTVVPAYASDTNSSPKTDNICRGELCSPQQVKPPESLSLQDAIKYMQENSRRAETLKQNAKADKVVAEGYSEKVSSITRAQRALDDGERELSARVAKNELGHKMGKVTADEYKQNLQSLAAGSQALFQKTYEAHVKGVSSNNKDIMILRRDFANAHLESNKKAELNEIEANTIDVYYKVLLATENYNISTQNVKTQEKTKALAEKKKAVGLVAKKDVLSVNSALAEAKTRQREAWTQLQMAKMGFNFLLGYPVMSNITLTDKISDEVTNDEESVEAGVANTLKNRQELPGAKLATEIYAILLKDVSYYPHSSATYMTAELDLQEAQKTLKDAPIKLEIDTRNKYNQLQDRKHEVEAAKELLAYAKEGERLMLLTYDAGISTIDELLEVQIKRNKAELNLAKCKSDYALAKKAYEYAQGVGTSRLPL